jgi:hypothetical protein
MEMGYGNEPHAADTQAGSFPADLRTFSGIEQVGLAFESQGHRSK